MSIKFQNQTIAGKYKEQIIPFANTIDAGIAKIATQEEINEGTNNTSIITPLYLSAKQDKLTAGKGISIDATNTISSDISIDNITIVQNDDKSLSTVARKTKNDKIIIDWEGTEAEYHQALLNNEINPDWYCYITDDEQAVSYVDVVHRNLDNLSPEGQAKFDEKSNIDLDNLSPEGQAKFDEKSNIDLDNLSEVGEKHFLGKSQITNCITSIPQNIKLDLADGILTLKAGSIVTIPNGFEDDGVTPKFDYVTIENDKTMPSETTTAAQRMCWVALSAGGYANGVVQWCFSGNTSLMNSTAPNAYSTFYNTEINKMYRGNGTVWEEQQFSLPICLATNDSSGQYVSIDQIFNGFGYIGSTVWADKGVKFLIPNGRNEDGTLNNIEKTLENTVLSANVHNWNGAHKLNLMLTEEYINAQSSVRFSIDKIIPNSQPICYSYSEKDNYWYYTTDTGANWTILQSVLIGSIYSISSSLSIQNVQIKKPFRALDYNDKPEITTWGTPSNNFYDLTYGGHGSTYIAPANGFFTLAGYGVVGDIYLINTATGLINSAKGSASSTSVVGCFLPCKKGDTIKAGYYNGTVTEFKFVFAQGEMA